MRYFSDVNRDNLIDRTRTVQENYVVSNRPATTSVYRNFNRGAYRASPGNDPYYQSDFTEKKSKWWWFGNHEKTEQKSTMYEGDLSLSRHRTLGLVNELIDSHCADTNDPNATLAAGISVGKQQGRKLTVEEQQGKLEDLQRALLEEAAFLEKLKDYKEDPPSCCPEWCMGDKDRSLLGGCIKCHWCCEFGDFEDHYNQPRRQANSAFSHELHGAPAPAAHGLMGPFSGP